MYEQKVKLTHEEHVEIVNGNSGEVKRVRRGPSNLPENKEIFDPPTRWAKFYNTAMDYMLEVFKPIELKIIMQMMAMAREHSNSLKPINDDTSIAELGKTFGIHRNNVKKLLNKLYNHGVYAEFDFAKAPLSFDPNDPSTFNNESKRTKYWVLNPYIAFRGKTIDTALVDLFRETKIARYVKNILDKD